MAAVWTTLSGRSVKSVQAATESYPTTEVPPAVGLNTNDLNGFVIYVLADSGQTITSSAVGTFDGSMWDEELALWVPATDIDFVVPARAVGTRGFTVSGWTVSTPRIWIAHTARSVAVSGGGITIKYKCSTLYGEQT